MFCNYTMGKQHQTFPGEPEEMPDKKDQPEIKQPNDPKEYLVNYLLISHPAKTTNL